MNAAVFTDFYEPQILDKHSNSFQRTDSREWWKFVPIYAEKWSNQVLQTPLTTDTVTFEM